MTDGTVSTSWSYGSTAEDIVDAEASRATQHNKKKNNAARDGALCRVIDDRLSRFKIFLQTVVCEFAVHLGYSLCEIAVGREKPAS
jgi:hypothetical protein